MELIKPKSNNYQTLLAMDSDEGSLRWMTTDNVFEQDFLRDTVEEGSGSETIASGKRSQTGVVVEFRKSPWRR